MKSLGKRDYQKADYYVRYKRLCQLVCRLVEASDENEIKAPEDKKNKTEKCKICVHKSVLPVKRGIFKCCHSEKREYEHDQKADEFYEKAELIRKYFTHPALTTDIIVGFPGETEEEFAETCRFVDRIDFYETHIFKYSKRKGTVAATMPGQLTEAQKAVRSDVLEEKNAMHSLEFRRELVGEKVLILTEETKEIDGAIYTVGHTMDYVMMALPGEYAGNQIIGGTVEGFLRNDIMLLKIDKE